MSVEIMNSVGAPESLNGRFFQEVLENALFETDLKIRKLSFERGSAIGDNFCSQIYRVQITFCRSNDDKRLDDLSVIVKSMPTSNELKFLLDLKAFVKEKIFYTHMIPRLEILLDNVKLAGRLYYGAKEPINTLVFEDLGASDYIMGNRAEGLDVDHCQLVMKKLGYLHGSSLILHKKDPDCMKSFHSSLLSEDCLNGSDTFETVFRFSFDSVVRHVSTWQGYESITKKLQKYATNFKENLIKTQLPIPGELKVLNHGDLWVNNFLFKYNNKETKESVQDVIFIDLQMSIFGSPGFDLNYFFYTSMQLDVLKEKREELLKTYYKSFSDTLKAYKYENIPSFEDILLEVRRREPFGFFANYGVFPGVSMDKSESSDNTLEKFMDEDFANKKGDVMFSSQRLRDTMRYTLKRFDELGVLD
ncbi:uncharacterized protein LOC129910934 [Episyrphus balteatus]|uniref:uncharacterized protein LOC129910934 n=1 Tax=Episyrphus balteatus TaxID=286459 RepID=UPI002485F525|nr:uncharacterized protein LOC129910934 [Episyrphus balteatus]